MIELVIWSATALVGLGWLVFVINAPKYKENEDEIS